MSERQSTRAATVIDIRVVSAAGESRGLALLIRSVLRAVLHLLTFGLIPESARTAVQISLKETGALIHETEWKFDAEGAVALADEMKADASRMSLLEFCQEWNIRPPQIEIT